MFIESARAVIQLKEICLAATKLKSKSRLVPEALVFGSDDYVADVGATRTAAATELTYARQKVVAVAKAFGLQVSRSSMSCTTILIADLGPFMTWGHSF